MRTQTIIPISTDSAWLIFLKPCLCRMAMLALLFLLSGTNLLAASNLNLPPEFGTVVYQTHGNDPTQLFIITNSHRSPISGANGDNTLQAQVETFQIGEWLIRRHHVSRIFPEGFFGRRSATNPEVAPDEWFDRATLARWLADTSSFVNAELLLHEHFGVDLQQVEDRELYRNVREALLAGKAGETHETLALNERLETLQKRRSAAILRSATVLSQSRQSGSDLPESAILTIGLSHLGDILNLVEYGELHIPANHMTEAELLSMSKSPDSDQRPVGITVIVPHSLLESLPQELGQPLLTYSPVPPR